MEHELISKTISGLILRQPFYATLALYLKPKVMEEVKTCGTDGEYLYYAPSWFEALSARQREGVLAHEVMHCAFLHHTRRGNRDGDLWNIACDYAINENLFKAGFTLPEGALVDNQYAGMAAEEIYARLVSATNGSKGQSAQPLGVAGVGQNPMPSSAASAARDGQGEAGGYYPSRASGQASATPLFRGAQLSQCPWGTVFDAAPAYERARLGQIEAEAGRRVSQALAVLSAHAGHLPGYLEQLAKAIHKPQVNWREQLRRFVDDRSRVDYSFMKPNKRFMGLGIILPGIIPDGVTKLGVVMDTSGSVSADLLNQFLGELTAMMEEGAVHELVMLQCDTLVRQEHIIVDSEDLKDFKVVGRGGTKFGPALKWMQEFHPDVSALIYFTDLESDDFGTDPGIPLLWCAYGRESTLNQLERNVPFGEVIKCIQ